MPGKPFSLYDIHPVQIRLRRDQSRKIRAIVDANARFPQVALGLVRDYIKNSSARDTVEWVDFGNEPLDTREPKYIAVHSKNSASASVQQLGTVYYYRLNPDPRVEPPTL